MPNGFHLGYTQQRHYTTEYTKLYAKTFKVLLTKPLGSYLIASPNKSTPITLKQTKDGLRYITLNHQDNTLEIGLVICNKSASNKLYITCPYCHTKRQHLFDCKSGYACKACLNLHYASQSEQKQDRLARRIRKLRVALWGYKPEIMNLTNSVRWFTKPKYMRWTNYQKKRDQITKLEEQFWQISKEQIIKLYGE